MKKVKALQFHLQPKNVLIKKRFVQKNKHIFIFIFKLIVSLCTFYFIYIKIRKDNISDFSFPEISAFNILIFLISIFLMPLNWFAESVKWQFLIRKISEINLKTAVEAVLTGMPFALFTPARTGEIVGRVLGLEKKFRKKAVLLTALGSYAQMTATLIAGFVGGLLLMFLYENKLQQLNPEFILVLKSVTLLLFALSILILLKLKLIVRFLQKLNLNEKYLKYFKILSDFKTKELLYVLLLSLGRYFIFSVQFYLLLLLFDVNITVIQAFIGITMTYLLSSLIPVLSIFEIGVRGGAALIFLALFTTDLSDILAAVTILWLLNNALPVLFGIVVFNRTKL